MPIKIKTEWVKGHSSNKVKTIQEHLNILANTIAREYAIEPHPSFAPLSMPLSPSMSTIQLCLNNSIITSKLYETLHTANAL
jgi:hypothetical protein